MLDGKRGNGTEKEGQVAMLEESMKMFNVLSVNFEEFDKSEKEWYKKRRERRDTACVTLQNIFSNSNSNEIKAFASELIEMRCEDVVIQSTNDVFRCLMEMLIVNTKYSLAIIDREFAELKKPTGSTTEDVEKIKLLEENILSLKTQLETMKPLFQKFKKDYAARKKYLNENR